MGQQPDGVFDVMNTSLIFWEVAALIVVIVIVALGVLAFRRLMTATPTPARRILDERYARGEIGRDEYEQRRRDLRR